MDNMGAALLQLQNMIPLYQEEEIQPPELVSPSVIARRARLQRSRAWPVSLISQYP